MQITIRDGAAPKILRKLMETFAAEDGSGPAVVVYLKGGSFIGGHVTSVSDNGVVTIGQSVIMPSDIANVVV